MEQLQQEASALGSPDLAAIMEEEEEGTEDETSDFRGSTSQVDSTDSNDDSQSQDSGNMGSEGSGEDNGGESGDANSGEGQDGDGPVGMSSAEYEGLMSLGLPAEQMNVSIDMACGVFVQC
jgi:hypothetical protein